MARVRFTQNFDYRPTRRRIVCYRAGGEYTVRRACADQAVALGKAVEIAAPPRPAALPRSRRRVAP